MTDTTTKKHPLIGVKVRYQPRQIPTDKPAEGIIEMYEPAGAIFNQDMLSIPEVPHWIPAADCNIERV